MTSRLSEIQKADRRRYAPSWKYRRIYWALCRVGHSPAKAVDILYDASRGNKHAMRWIRIAKQNRKIKR